MHGLVNWSIQCFVRDTYGRTSWERVIQASKIAETNFEPLLTYDDATTFALVDAACQFLERPRETLLEDLGTYLCTHKNLEAVRRLLRFGGETFPEFLCSLDDLADRTHLAVPDLEMPQIELRLNSPGSVTMLCRSKHPVFGHVLVGVLRAMADDYGMLVLLEHLGRNDSEEVIAVQMLDERFARGREFILSRGAA